MTDTTSSMDREISDYLSEEFIECYYPGERRHIINIDYIKEKMFSLYGKYLEEVTVKLEMKAMKRGERDESEGDESDEDEESPKPRFVNGVVTLFSFDKVSARWCLNDDDWDLLHHSTTHMINNGIYEYKTKLNKKEETKDTSTQTSSDNE